MAELLTGKSKKRRRAMWHVWWRSGAARSVTWPLCWCSVSGFAAYTLLLSQKNSSIHGSALNWTRPNPTTTGSAFLSVRTTYRRPSHGFAARNPKASKACREDRSVPYHRGYGGIIPPRLPGSRRRPFPEPRWGPRRAQVSDPAGIAFDALRRGVREIIPAGAASLTPVTIIRNLLDW
jgi:hypothetical protein